MKTLFIGNLMLLIAIFNSCNIVNPKEGIPTYIQIDSVQLSSNDINKTGSTSHKITDVWVYYNRQLLGAYQIPAKVPVLATGNGEIELFAGIYDNALAGTRGKYPFYNVDTFTFNASPTNTIHYLPKFTYRTTTNVSYFVENFEQGNNFTKRSGDTTITRTSNAAEVFENDWSGKIELHDSIQTAEATTTQDFYLPANKQAYLELNYKSDIDFLINTEIYYLGSNTYSSIMGLKANNNWTKVYLDLTGFAATYQGGKFKFIIKANLPSTSTSAKLLFDNFKIIYFN